MSDEKTRWPFGGFFLKLSDEKNGTHEYEEYLRNCKENPCFDNPLKMNAG